MNTWYVIYFVVGIIVGAPLGYYLRDIIVDRAMRRFIRNQEEDDE